MREPVNILMVDDQAGKLLSYEAILAELGENLIRASSAREAFEYLMKNEIAVILMDVNMPELNGFDLAAMIHDHPRFQNTAIVFISAVHLSDLDKLRGYERGAVDYIAVPIIPELLRARVRVFAELHRKTRQLETLYRRVCILSEKVTAAQELERRRIARALHDSLGQQLSAAKMTVDQIPARPPELKDQAAAQVSELLDTALQEVRTISHLLHPPLLDEAGLSSALAVYLEGFKQRSNIEIFTTVEPANFPRLSADIEIALFRIVQEAVNNVFRHAGARNTWISLRKTDVDLSLSVRDDGVGVPENVLHLEPRALGVGLAGMMQRVEEFGGQLKLKRGDRGTTLEVSIPLETVIETGDATLGQVHDIVNRPYELALNSSSNIEEPLSVRKTD
jgi:signal transduction histidine kinase